ncbi:unnamed protein product [Polarella glacialis]|uniref:Uncharacterized protein n=1 Tax=Polarella glacialis TaxID=89957 RepID=A0A813I1C5_POLGL|nr:unnamed protein product [Polarella glacialis]
MAGLPDKQAPAAPPTLWTTLGSGKAKRPVVIDGEICHDTGEYTLSLLDQASGSPSLPVIHKEVLWMYAASTCFCCDLRDRQLLCVLGKHEEGEEHFERTHGTLQSFEAGQDVRHISQIELVYHDGDVLSIGLRCSCGEDSAYFRSLTDALRSQARLTVCRSSCCKTQRRSVELPPVHVPDEAAEAEACRHMLELLASEELAKANAQKTAARRISNQQLLDVLSQEDKSNYHAFAGPGTAITSHKTSDEAHEAKEIPIQDEGIKSSPAAATTEVVQCSSVAPCSEQESFNSDRLKHLDSFNVASLPPEAFKSRACGPQQEEDRRVVALQQELNEVRAMFATSLATQAEQLKLIACLREQQVFECGDVFTGEFLFSARPVLKLVGPPGLGVHSVTTCSGEPAKVQLTYHGAAFVAGGPIPSTTIPREPMFLTQTFEGSHFSLAKNRTVDGNVLPPHEWLMPEDRDDASTGSTVCCIAGECGEETEEACKHMDKPMPEGQLPFNEAFYRTAKALTAKGQLLLLTDAINNMVKEPDSPGGRIREIRFRQVLEDTARGVLEVDELKAIFPQPKPGLVRRNSGLTKAKREAALAMSTSTAPALEKK